MAQFTPADMTSTHLLHLSQPFHLVQHGTEQQKKAALVKLIDCIKQDQMGPFYAHLIEKFGVTKEKALFDNLTAQNAATLTKLQERLADAQENLGETDISDALVAIADHYSKIGDKANAESAYSQAYEKTGPLGHRIDIVFSLIRVGFFYKDHDLINSNIDKAKRFVL